MINLFLTLHLICSIILIIFILINKGKGSDLGAINQNNELLSHKDSNSILNKIIIVIVLLSLSINISLTFLNKNTSDKSGKTIVDLSKYQLYYK